MDKCNDNKYVAQVTLKFTKDDRNKLRDGAMKCSLPITDYIRKLLFDESQRDNVPGLSKGETDNILLNIKKSFSKIAKEYMKFVNTYKESLSVRGNGGDSATAATLSAVVRLSELTFRLQSSLNDLFFKNGIKTEYFATKVSLPSPDDKVEEIRGVLGAKVTLVGKLIKDAEKYTAKNGAVKMKLALSCNDKNADQTTHYDYQVYVVDYTLYRVLLKGSVVEVCGNQKVSSRGCVSIFADTVTIIS